MASTISRSNTSLIAAGFLLTFWSSPGQTFFISLLGDDLRALLDLNHAQFGAMYSMATLGSAVLLLWTGTLIDKLPLPSMVYSVVFCLAASLLLLSMSESTGLVFLALLLLRHFGQGLMMLIASSSIVRYLDKLRGRGTALSGLGYIFAEASLPATIIFISTQYGWRNALISAAAILIAVILPLLAFLLRGHKQRHEQYLERLHQPAHEQHSKKEPRQNNAVSPKMPQKHWQRREVLRDPGFYLVMPLMLMHPMLFTGFIFHQLHLVETKGWTLELWGQLFTLYALCGIVAKLATGFAIDKYTAMRIVPVGGIMLITGLTVLGLSSEIYAAYIFMIFLGITTGMQTTVSAPFWVEMYGSQYIGSIKSVTTFTMVTGTAVSPVVMGILIDSGVTINAIAIGSVVYIFVALALAFLALRLHKKRS